MFSLSGNVKPIVFSVVQPEETGETHINKRMGEIMAKRLSEKFKMPPIHRSGSIMPSKGMRVSIWLIVEMHIKYLQSARIVHSPTHTNEHTHTHAHTYSATPIHDPGWMNWTEPKLKRNERNATFKNENQFWRFLETVLTIISDWQYKSDERREKTRKTTKIGNWKSSTFHCI